MNKYIFWAYITAIVLLVTLPINGASELNNITILQFRGDYFFHSLMFIPWGIFQHLNRSNIWLWLITGLLFASFSEGIQHLLPYRAFNINDLAANNIGAIIGFIAINVFTMVKRKLA